MEKKKVLVEYADMPNGLFFPDYIGTVMGETKDRYLVRHHLILKSWVAKNSPMARCELLTTTQKEGEHE